MVCLCVFSSACSTFLMVSNKMDLWSPEMVSPSLSPSFFAVFAAGVLGWWWRGGGCRCYSYWGFQFVVALSLVWNKKFHNNSIKFFSINFFPLEWKIYLFFNLQNFHLDIKEIINDFVRNFFSCKMNNTKHSVGELDYDLGLNTLFCWVPCTIVNV